MAELVPKKDNVGAALSRGSGEEGKIINKEKVGDFGDRSGDRDGAPGLISHSLVNVPRKPFHTEDEDIRGNRVTLSNTSRRVEVVSFGPINKDRDGGGGDARHDKLGEVSGEVEEFKGV